MLAKFDWTDVPFQFFLGFNGLDHISQSAVAGATTCILEQFPQPLMDAGFSPDSLAVIRIRWRSLQSRNSG